MNYNYGNFFFYTIKKEIHRVINYFIINKYTLWEHVYSGGYIFHKFLTPEVLILWCISPLQTGYNKSLGHTAVSDVVPFPSIIHVLSSIRYSYSFTSCSTTPHLTSIENTSLVVFQFFKMSHLYFTYFFAVVIMERQQEKDKMYKIWLVNKNKCC